MAAMNKKAMKAAILAAIFIVAVIVLNLLTGSKTVDLTAEMPEATLPVVTLKKGDVSINKLFGYRQEMDAATMRDTITPLAENRILPVSIQVYENHVEEISYQVRTMDMERLLEETYISDFTQKDGMVETLFHIQNLLEEDQEYMLIITLTCPAGEVRYYTRIICASDAYVDQSLDFVQEFHKNTFDSDASSQLATYLESNGDGDNTTLQRVNIHSSLSQVAWADFEGEVLVEPVISVKEISNNYNTLVMQYVVAATGENGETEFYNVEEYYRTRYSLENNRMLLLDYERTTNEIFGASGDSFTKTAIELGLRDLDVSYMTNENATIVSFVQEGDLWSYNSNSNQLSQIYSFRGLEGLDERENHGEHDIRIIKVSESGSIDFVVYGYMNRGEHEGYTGVGVYHFDSIANTIQEELFVQSTESYQVLKENWGKLFYTSGEGYFYLLAEDSLYKVNLNTGEEQCICAGLSEDDVAASESGRYIAWRETDSKNLVTVMDLEGEEQWQIQEAEGSLITPIGFVESDFVYGLTKQEDVLDDQEYMYEILIMDKEQNIIKEYEKAGYYVSNAYVEDSTVILERVRKEATAYVSVEADAIKSHEIEASQKIQIETKVTQEKQTQVRLVTNQSFSGKSPHLLTPREVVLEERNLLALESTDRQHYYVYVGGKIIFSSERPQEAIAQADANAGAVIDDAQSYIWRRGRRSNISMASQALLSQEEVLGITDATARCLTALLKKEEISFDITGLVENGTSPAEILQEAMPQAKVMNLTGCSVSQILYYVAQGNLVYALGENQQPILIVGYDEVNTILYDPATNTSYRKGLQDSEEFFADSGYTFITYLTEQ